MMPMAILHNCLIYRPWNGITRIKLVEVRLNAGTNPDKAIYQYDGQGQRIRKTLIKNNGNHIAERIYIGGYEIYTEVVGGALQKHRDTIHITDDQDRIAIFERERDINNLVQITSQTLRYEMSNHLGSSALELDQNAQLISYEEYYPYGGSSYTAGRNLAETSLKRYRYSGKERDDETGLYYYGARYYAPWMGRWMSCDPLGNFDHHNLYMFTRGDPIGAVDTNGLATSPNKDSQKSKTVGVATDTSQEVYNPETGYSANIDTATGIIIINEGDWLSKANAALTGSTDPKSAANNFEVKTGDQWVPFEDTLDPNKLEVGDQVRFRDYKPKPVEPPQEKTKNKFFGGEIDHENKSVKGFVGIDEQKGPVGVKALRAEGEAGGGGTFGKVNLASVSGKIPIGAADLDVSLDTPKASAGLYLGTTKTNENGDTESTYGIEALGSVLEVGAGSETKDKTVGGGGSLGLGAGAKVKATVRADTKGIKAVTVDLEGKFIGGANIQFTVPTRLPESNSEKSK